MSVSPVANRSFLHGVGKLSPTSERIIYTTIDSLALKRATLPLQLLPVDDNQVTSEIPSESMEKKEVSAAPTTRKSDSKVDATSSSSQQHAKYLLAVPSRKSERKEIGPNITDEYPEPIAEQQNGKKNMACLPSTVTGNDNGDIKVPSIRLTIEESGAKIRSDFRHEHFSQEIDRSSNSCQNLLNGEDTVSSNRGRVSEDFSSDDYEKIGEESVCETAASWNISKTVCKSDTRVEKNEEALRSKGTFVKAKSTNDLTTKGTSDRLTGSHSRMFVNEHFACDKKKKHFAKNVLNFVPEYLAKGSKRREKTKDIVNESLASMKASSTDTKDEIDSKARYRSRSLPRGELKYLKISSPSNFVHVASATNPNLVSNGNAVRFNLEQVVITHEEKRATLPLLVARSDYAMPDSCTEQSSDVAPARITGGASSIVGKPKEEATAHKGNSFDVAKLRRELLFELQARSTKALEMCQRVKTSEYPMNSWGRESALPVSPVELPANSSFLWSNRTRGIVGNPRCGLPRYTSSENRTQDIDDTGEVYDDVVPLNLISGQEEDDYDDVGTPILPTDGNCADESSTAFEESDCIYDDVLGPSSTGRASFADNESEIRQDTPRQGENDYAPLFNEYSKVDEEKDELEDAQDVYDDVGLPGVEWVNSLYAGSTIGSILGSTMWTDGKESEWEDLEDPSAISVHSSSTSNNNLFRETRVTGSRTKLGRRWSREIRRERSKLSKKYLRFSSKASDSSFSVTISLGRGSVLLVGRAEEELEEWREEREDRMQRENSQRTQGLVQIRVIDLDEDVDTQETSCYVHEDGISDDSTYESFHSLHPDDSSTISDMEIVDEPIDHGCGNAEMEQTVESNQLVIAYSEAPTKPNPPPPREVSLSRTLGRRIKMLRRTWSITKGSLGRMRRRTSTQDDHPCEESRESSNDHSNLDGGRYFGFARHFKRNVSGPLSTFYLNGYTGNGSADSAVNAEATYSNSNEEVDHYSILADQEPLYQFYAEAIARVAFDSNSDGYEEVENTMPSQSTTDLAKPGQRTLWCQTPQVMNNGLLQRLNAEEKRIQEAKFEILTSEASYLNSLRVLRSEFLNDPSINEILTQTEKNKLFADIPNILHESEQFLAELETLWRQDPMLCDLPDLLLKYADKCLDIYVPYCSNQVSIDTALKSFKTRKGPKFDETISRIEAREACQSLSLHSFLMLPMQRITRLPLLTDAVLSKLPAEHVDKSEWERVLSNFSYVVTACNEAARAAAKEMEMENLARKLEYSVKIKPIVLKGKYLIKSGPVVQLSTKTDAEYKLTFGKRFNKTPLYLLLLTDYLLVAKYKPSAPDETYTVIDTCKRSLITLESIPEDSPFAGRNAMLLTLLENYAEHQVEYILTCESDTERQRWLEAVSPSNRGLIGETLYEVWDCPQVVVLYSYSPNQPDELSLHPGEVINVFTKMSDGWYQGEKLLNGEQGWFPGNYTKEVASEHVRAKNLKQRHRFLALSVKPLQRRT